MLVSIEVRYIRFVICVDEGSITISISKAVSHIPHSHISSRMHFELLVVVIV